MFGSRRLRAERSQIIGELFWSFLGRAPEPEALSFYLAELESGYTLRDIVLQIQASAEYQRRYGEPSASRPPTQAQRDEQQGLHIIVTTGDGWAKVAAQVALLKASLGPHERVSVIDGSVGKGAEDHELEPGRVDLIRYPGHSVFHLRQRIPSLAGGARWVALMEDHTGVTVEWLAKVRDILRCATEDTSAIVGSFTNRRSVGRWSWANFLITFAPYWHPMLPGGDYALPIANLIVAGRLLPPDDFKFGELENRFLPSLLDQTIRRDDIPVDHEQNRGFIAATAHQFHNARVAGACMRMAYPDAMTGLRRGLRRLVIERPREVRAIVAQHPLESDTPRLTWLRLRWLSLAIAAGYVWGSCFGVGQSPWRME